MNNIGTKLKIIGFSVPIKYADRIAAIARQERRTKRSVFEAMVDLYEETRQKEKAFNDMVIRTIAEAEQEKKTNPKTTEELLREFRGITQMNRERLKAQGINFSDEDINKMVYEDRQKREKRNWLQSGT